MWTYIVGICLILVAVLGERHPRPAPIPSHPRPPPRRAPTCAHSLPIALARADSMGFLERLQANKRKQEEDGDGDSAPDATLPGVVRKAPRPDSTTDPNAPIDVAKTDVIIVGYVMQFCGTGKYESSKMVVLVTSIHVPDSAPHMKILPSGLAVVLGTRKHSTGEKLKFPHKFTTGLGIVPATVVAEFKLKEISGKPPSTVLTPGKRVELKGVVWRTRESIGGEQVFDCDVKSVELVEGQQTVLPINAKEALFRAMSTSSYANTANHYFYRNRYGHTTKEDFEAAVKDCLALKELIDKNLQMYSNTKLSVGYEKDSGELKTIPLIPEDVKVFFQQVSVRLELYAAQSYSNHLNHRGNDNFLGSTGFGHLDATGSHDSMCFPLFQLAMKPSWAKAIGADTSPKGIFEACLKDGEDEECEDEKHKEMAAKLSNTAAQIVLKTTDEAIDFNPQYPPNIVEFQITAANLGRKDENSEWYFLTPKIKMENGDTPSIVAWTIKTSLKYTGMNLRNMIGMDDDRLPIIISTLIPYANAVFMCNVSSQNVLAYVAPGSAYSSQQPAMPDDSWGLRNIMYNPKPNNVVDWKNAIENVGIAVPRATVEQYAVDEAGDTLAALNKGEVGFYAMPPKDSQKPPPPKLDPAVLASEGYWCVNGEPDVDFVKKLKIIPEGAVDVVFYAVFKGCDKIEDHESANAQTEEGLAKGKEIIDAFPDKANINKHVAFYAVAVAMKA